jgi:predicted kinase
MLKITVVGDARSGKTTIAHIIASELGAYGIRTQIVDLPPDGAPVIDFLKRGAYLASKYKGEPIIIETKQADRSI